MMKKKRISMDKNQGNLKSIISSSADIENESKDISPANPQSINGFDMVKCHGWIMNRRVWIQVLGHAL